MRDCHYSDHGYETYHCCTVSDKLRIIQFTEQHGNHTAEQRYMLPHTGSVVQKVDKAIN